MKRLTKIMKAVALAPESATPHTQAAFIPPMSSSRS